MQDDLRARIENLRGYRMTPDEIAEQRIAFAFGNAPHEVNTTKEQVRDLINSATAPEGVQTTP